MARYLFASHDGFGLGHARRNSLIARALLSVDPTADITLVTGISSSHWLFDTPRVQVVHVPPLVKDHDGSYRASGQSFDEAIDARRRVVAEQVAAHRPDVVVVDRHPFGLAGELHEGLVAARAAGAALVLGLRSVLDDPTVVRAELAGAGWHGVDEMFDRVLVYGTPTLCDHAAEYGMTVALTYCGFVTEVVPRVVSDERVLVVAAGGGADGEQVFGLGAQLLARLPDWRGIVAAGPFADLSTLSRLGLDRDGRVEVRRNVRGLTSLFASASATLQMAGYNTTFEALGAGLRPILVPRRSPRREQAIQASRLASMGVADVVDAGASVDEVEWFLRSPRLLAAGALDAAGLRLDGAVRAAAHLAELAGVRRSA